MFGREVLAPIDFVYGTPSPDSPVTYEDYTEEMSDRIKKACAIVRENLKRAAERNRRYYDLRVKPRRYAVGDWVYYFNPRRYKGKQEKWMRKYSGPYLVEKVVGEVNVVIRKNRNAKPITVHIDKLKPYTAGDTPPSWLKEVPIETTVKREPRIEGEMKRDDEEWIDENEDEVEAPNIHGSQEEISVLTSPKTSVVVPEEDSSRKPEGEVPDEQPIAGIPPARYKTPRPKRERRVPIRYRW